MRISQVSAALWRVLAALVLAAATVPMAGCGEQAERAEGPVRVVVSIGPLAGLVRPLLPPDAEITVLVPPGESVHGYDLPPEMVGALASADLVAVVGLGIESDFARALRRAEGAVAVTMAEASGVDHTHDHAHHHHHSDGESCSPDAHLWLKPEHAESFVKAFAEAVNGWAADHGVEWDAKRAAMELSARIRLTEAELQQDLAPFEGAVIITHHNSFTSFAERYGMTVAGVVRPVESLDPTASELADLRTAAVEEGAQAVFVEPQFAPTAAMRLADELGLPVGTLDPLGSSEGGDWFELIASIRDGLVSTLGRETGEVPGEVSAGG